MKITRDSRKVDKRQLAKAEANKGCDICPCYGETKSILDYVDECIIDKGISRGAYRYSGWTGKRKDLYKCYTCGAEWESDWYKGF